MISDKTEGGRLETIFLALEDAAIMIHELRAERDAACLREPTQAEGDAHEYRNDQGMGASYGAGESFVPMGSHHGWRCRCGTWVWGGPTVCQRCVDAAAVKIAVEWKAEADRLRKLFDDAGQGEHNVLALIDHYQDRAIYAERKLDSVKEVLEKNGRDCDCPGHCEDLSDDLGTCLACKIAKVVDK